MQPYRPSFWRVATEEINYRRFFDINDLAAIKVENPEVFYDTHRLIFDLIRMGAITGLRVDHVDGLYDPEEYLRRLQRNAFLNSALGALALSEDESKELRGRLEALFEELYSNNIPPFYVVGEKILVDDEEIPSSWALHGTTGYDFLYYLNSLFVRKKNEKQMTRIYSRFTGDSRRFEEVLLESKRLNITERLGPAVSMKKDAYSEPAVTDTAVAFCRGFLTTRGQNTETAELFCKAFLQSIYRGNDT